MLSREKESPRNFKIQRNNTVALTYDIQNTSTKLVMLNFANKKENRIREHSAIKDKSALGKDFKCCYCLNNTAPACACHHRDKDLSHNPRKNECGSRKLCDASKNRRTVQSACRKPHATERPVQWPSLSKEELSALEKRNQRNYSQKSPGRYCDKDMWLISSIPALRHPDITDGQRQYLLSLAKIYTDVSPGPRSRNTWTAKDLSKSTPASRNEVDRNNRSKSNKRKKASKKDTPVKRKASLPTAVWIFQNTQTNDVGPTSEDKLDAHDVNEPENNDNVDDDNVNAEIESDEELEDLLDNYVMSVLQKQADELGYHNNLKIGERQLVLEAKVENESLENDAARSDKIISPIKMKEDSDTIENFLDNEENLSNYQTLAVTMENETNTIDNFINNDDALSDEKIEIIANEDTPHNVDELNNKDIADNAHKTDIDSPKELNEPVLFLGEME